MSGSDPLTLFCLCVSGSDPLTLFCLRLVLIRSLCSVSVSGSDPLTLFCLCVSGSDPLTLFCLRLVLIRSLCSVSVSGSDPLTLFCLRLVLIRSLCSVSVCLVLIRSLCSVAAVLKAVDGLDCGESLRLISANGLVSEDSFNHAVAGLYALLKEALSLPSLTQEVSSALSSSPIHKGLLWSQSHINACSSSKLI